MTGKFETTDRAAVEDFLYLEAAILDGWDLDAWLDLMCEDATYLVPPNEAPDSDPDDTLFIIADDIHRIRSRVKRLKSPGCTRGVSAVAHKAADHKCPYSGKFGHAGDRNVELFGPPVPSRRKRRRLCRPVRSSAAAGRRQLQDRRAGG